MKIKILCYGIFILIYPVTLAMVPIIFPNIWMEKSFKILYHLIVIGIMMYCLYQVFLIRFFEEIKEIDTMDRFILDTEFKISIDLRNKLDDIFIKLLSFFILLTSGFIYDNLEDKSFDFLAVKDLLDKEIFYLIGIAFYLVFGGILAFSSANEKKIKELKYKYKNNINKE